MHSRSFPSMPPGAIIGYLKNGRPIRFIAGGSEPDQGSGTGAGTGDGQGGTGAGEGQQDPGTQGGGAGTGGQGSAETGSPAQPPGDSTGQQPGDSNAMRAVRDELRQVKADRKTLKDQLDKLTADNEARAAADLERNRKLAIALGVAPDDPPDPEKLAAELASARQAIQQADTAGKIRERGLRVELELLRQAAAHGADATLLSDSRTFMATLADLDPDSGDFGVDLGEAIAKAMETNPRFKIAQPPPPAPGGDGQNGSGTNGSKTTAPPRPSGSGGDTGHNAAPGGNRQWTDEDVDRATPAEVDAAVEAGLLTGMGYYPRRKRR